MDVMFEVPESDITCVKIDDEVVLGKKSVEFVRKSAATTKSSGDSKSDASSESGSGEFADSEKSESDEQKSKAKTYA